MSMEPEIAAPAEEVENVNFGDRAAWKAFIKVLEAQTNALEEVGLNDISLGPWSHSKLKTLEKCPQQFFLKYVLKAKIPAALAVNQDTSAADVGSAAHKILEHVFSGHTIKIAYMLAKEEFVPSKLSEEMWVEKIESVEYNITQFKDRIDNFKRGNRVKKIYQELKLGVTRDWKPTKFFASDVWMRGIVDFVILLENGDVMIIDWKYGPPIIAGIRNYEQQLSSYKPLIHFGLIPIKGATAGVGFIREGDILLGEYTDVETIERKLKNTIEFNVEGAIESVKTMGNFGHKVNSGCQYCEYSPICKSKKADGNLKVLEKMTGKFIPIQSV
jgi:hypothetical protein